MLIVDVLHDLARSDQEPAARRAPIDRHSTSITATRLAG